MMKTEITRPPIESLACVEPECDLYGQPGQGSLVKVDRSVVQRLNQVVGQHGQRYHEAQVQGVEVSALQADERHGFCETKQGALWEAEMIDPQSKLVLSHVQGRRDERLIRRLYQDTAGRVAQRHNLVLFTDGEHSYASLFPEYFGVAYQPSRQGSRGRRPKTRYRIPRTLAHVQIVKQRVGHRVVQVDIRYAHGSRKCAHQALAHLGYAQPNTSAIERRNGTARRVTVYQTRKSLAFARRPQVKTARGWWGVTVYNWCRAHRSLRQPLRQPVGKKSTSNVHPLWSLAWHNGFSPSGTSCSRPSIPQSPEIISHDYLSESRREFDIPHHEIHNDFSG